MANLKVERNGGSSRQEVGTNRVTERFQAAAQGAQPDWGRIDAQLIWAVVQRLTTDDGAVMFGYSRDGGAYQFKVYAGSEPLKKYCHSDSEMIDFLNYLLEG